MREKYETYREILEAERLIAAKAEDMVLHYAANILPNGFKAMVVAVSRLAAVRYRNALETARDTLLQRLAQLTPEQLALPEAELKLLPEDDELRKLLLAYPQRELLKELQFAAVISSDAKDYEHDERLQWDQWTNQQAIDQHIEDFKKPLLHDDSTQRSPLAFLCVRSMLITGFDAPQVQALYLDRSIKDHELLQAIARVNRVSPNKTNGLVVDYFGIANNLKEALSAYSVYDVQGALVSIKDELPLLADRHRRVLALFQAHTCPLDDLERCVNLLKDVKIRADFDVKLKKFLQSMDIVLPRPQALDYIADAQQLGLINKAASATYRDEQLNLHSIGNKVRRLIDEHIDALKIRQLIEPISILDAQFEQKLRRHQSDETNALEMEHAARDYIEYTFKQEDPTYYEQLSERLREIIDTLQDNWKQRVEALDDFILKARTPRAIDDTGLDPRTERPFLGILEQEVRRGTRRFAIPPTESGVGRELTHDEIMLLAASTRDIVRRIRQEISGYDDFWLNIESQATLRSHIAQMLVGQGGILIDPLQRRAFVVDRLMRLAHVLTSRLRDS
ncbi:MAG: type I restriction endonuclease subunit R [Ktedonobacteraceae bacterium]|nr:type I restriction endonuclease subunit R [Ktedonobacteraceae bacterium]